MNNLSEQLQSMSLSESTPTIRAAKEISQTLRAFSGRSDHLGSFINAIDRYYNRYGRTTDNSLNEFVFASICAKLIDEAGDFISCRPDLTTWPEIKQALKDKYGDNLDRYVLQQQFIFLTRNRQESINEFLEKIKLTKTKLNLKINTDNSLDSNMKQLLMFEMHKLKL